MTESSASSDGQQADPGTALAGSADWSAWPEPSVDGSAAVSSKKRARSPAQKSPRPNYFFALQVSTSATVTDAIKSVHRSLVDHTEALQKALVEAETAHLTVMVTALQTEAEIRNAEAAMDSFAAHLGADSAWNEPMSLTLQGLSQFRHQVLFLDVVRDAEYERLLAFARAVRDHMQQAGVPSTDTRDFAAHITVAKMSKMLGKKRKGVGKLKKIPEEAYAQHVNIEAGSVTLTGLQLCSMQGREAGSYYKVQMSVPICHSKCQ